MYYLLNETFMDVKKLPKFQWDRNDGERIGHGRNEWGKKREIKNIEKFETNDLKRNVDKKKCVTCGQNYEFIGSKFCSKNCYEHYFIPKFD